MASPFDQSPNIASDAGAKDPVMKNGMLFLICCFICTLLSAQHYQAVDKASSIKFIIKNMGMDTEGKFSGLEGNIVFNPADLSNASFNVSVDAGSVNTEIGVRDENLRGTEYLDTKKYQKISFVSRQITAAGKDRFLAKGSVTIKGISKEITFPFHVTTVADGIKLDAEMKLNRKDFKIGLNSVVLSDNLTVVLSVFAKKN